MGLKILGYDYTVTKDKTVDEIGAYGRCRPRNLTIQLANDLTVQQSESTMVHEILEALDYALQLKMDHDKLMALEAGLHSVLHDNGVDLTPLNK